MLLSEHLYPQTLSNYPTVFTIQCVSPYIFPRFNPWLWGGRLSLGPSCSQQPTVTALSAIPLIIAQRSPRVEPYCGVLGVRGAETSEESPLKDNKKTAD